MRAVAAVLMAGTLYIIATWAMGSLLVSLRVFGMPD